MGWPNVQFKICISQVLLQAQPMTSQRTSLSKTPGKSLSGLICLGDLVHFNARYKVWLEVWQPQRAMRLWPCDKRGEAETWQSQVTRGILVCKHGAASPPLRLCSEGDHCA